MLTWLLIGMAVALPLLLLATVVQRQQISRHLAENQARLQTMLDLTADWYWEQDADFRFTEMVGSSGCSKLMADRTLIGKQRWDIPCTNMDAAGWQRHRELLQRHESFYDLELVSEDALGERRYHLISGTAKFDAHGRFVGYRGTGQDVSARRIAEETARQLAHFDALTQLPNRALFMDRLQRALQRAHRGAQKTAVLLMDLDRFKDINDALGHEQGDKLLLQAAARMRACVRETDTVARLGGDEFVVIVDDLDNMDAAQTIAVKLLQCLEPPFELPGGRGHLSASIGIAMYPDDALNAEGLLRAADQAMYAAKDRGRNCFNFFTRSLQELAQKRTWLTQALHEALAGQQLWVAYQPIVDLATGQTHKAEALMRWRHPQHGLISPADFIPVAESSGLIHAMGEWVFEQALQQARRCRQTHAADFQISVNKSPVQFHKADAGSPRWPQRLRANGLPGNSVVAEITEGLLLDSSATVTQHLKDLRDAGIQVSLDDFGTGFSSLSYLHQQDIDYLKIDQCFVRNLSADSKDMALCEAMIVMAHKLGIQVIAEGVETAEQRDLLLRAGCDFGQGYWFARPMPPQEFETWLLQQRHRLNGARVPVAEVDGAAALAESAPARPICAPA